jgi:prepilin-type N-terminal cleavage/methylation domain-containing protein
MNKRRAFTLIELLIVVAIIAILAAIAVVNMREATERALKASDAANLHTLATALQSYVVDYNHLPPADAQAGPFRSENSAVVGDAPAAGGSWDGVPWLLYEMKYVSNWETLFCPKYLRLYRGGKTRKSNAPRYHNFRYAYNAGSAGHGGDQGGSGINTGAVWILRDLNIGPDAGWDAARYPGYPADYRYPWGDNDLEHVMYADFAVKLVKGGTDTPAR